MKKILGLDLGTTSIGWALVKEAETQQESSSIIKTGVRVNPLTVDELTNFEKGKSITSNANRTLKRSMRRNLQRYKLRRDNLLEVMKSHDIISDNTILSETGNYSTFKTYENRAKAASQEINLEEFAKVLLMINKKRGYKSSRKAKSQDEGQLIDGMDVAKKLYENNLTPGQFTYKLLQDGKKMIPDFYRSDLQEEIDKIWNFQKNKHPSLLTDSFKDELKTRGKMATQKLILAKYKIFTAENKGTREEKKLQAYKLRVNALSQELTKEELAFVLCEVNGDLNSSSGYLGSISDRSKVLFFNKWTVGQYLYKQISENSHARLKGQVFYRQDYMDEFETIWEEQSKHHKILTSKLKSELRDIIIFYQRRLKSQKGLINFCEFESRQLDFEIDGIKKTKTVGSRVCPRSSPLFQEFKIWQILNNLQLTKNKGRETYAIEIEHKQTLFNELNVKDKLTDKQVIQLLVGKGQVKGFELNYKSVEGNRTNAAFLNCFQKIIEASGHGEYLFEEMNADQINDVVYRVFQVLSIKTELLQFDSSLEGATLEQQPYFQLWHLLYSYEEDNSTTGNDALLKALTNKFGFEREYALILSNIVFQDDYGSVSAKAIRKILPHLKEGNLFDVACTHAGYNHSKSLTKEEKEKRVLKEKLEILPKNSLRNPVVEKILNQMINTVNSIIAEYGKPDEIRVELARDLKKSAKEREAATKSIAEATNNHERYRKILQTDFGLSYVSRNDIIRYKLYLELKENGFKTLYSDTYIEPAKLFSKDFDIEHIIPQSRLFDDSLSNKTLETRSVNIEKGDKTAFNYVRDKYGEDGLKLYEQRLEKLRNSKSDSPISRTKYKKLLMTSSDIPEGFIDRELRDTQYIAKKAKTLLENVFKEVNTTTGSITERLREDWQLVNVMQELNWDKYKALGLTYYETNKDGQKLPRIKDWTKRNDHRHHAMDALTVAFTKRSHVQYLNNLNARSDKSSSIYGIEQKELYRDERNKLRFKPPMPLDKFRAEAKQHLESTLISFKAKNKVVTKNKNTFKIGSGEKTKVELTPRGQLHLETVYGSILQYVTKEEKVGSNFCLETINKVSKQKIKDALLKRLSEFDNDPKKAFTGKNSLDKKPIYLDTLQTQRVPDKVKLVWLETVYTIRKEISPDLNVEKVIDPTIKSILEIRLKEFGNDPKKAFANLDENPIWLNKEKGILIKRVTISGISKANSLHSRKDKDGKSLKDSNGREIDSDFVNTGSNHHVAIFRDATGVLQEQVVSFFEAVERVNQGLPIVNKSYNSDEGWTFLFTMKQNEYFVFPNEKAGFNPIDIDLLNPNIYLSISPNLFRVQKITTKDYSFRHHLETTIDTKSETKGLTWKREGINGIGRLVKVRVNHLGKIVQVGEY